MFLSVAGARIVVCAVAGATSTVAVLAPPQASAGLALLLAVAGVAGAAAALPEPAKNVRANLPPGARWMVLCSFGAAVMAPILMEAGSAFGRGAGVAVLGLCAGFTTWGWVRLTCRPEEAEVSPVTSSNALREPRPAGPRPLVTVLETLSLLGLCVEWRRSYLELRMAGEPRAQAQLHEVRRCYLDEMQRRDPRGFSAWLVRDPYPVAGHPEQYLDVSGSTAAWPIRTEPDQGS